MKNKLRFSIGDNTYRLKSEKKGAFRKRNLPFRPVTPGHGNRFKSFRSLFYDLVFTNENFSFLSRGLSTTPKSPAFSDPEFRTDTTLSANATRFTRDLERLLSEILENLEASPRSLFFHHKKLKKVCSEFNLEIPRITAYDSVNSWGEFIKVLNSLNENESVHKFELFVALIFQYTERCK